MTLEEFILEWLSEILERDILTVESSASVSVGLRDLTDVNKWMAESVYEINAVFPSKRQSSEITRLIQMEVEALTIQNGINGVAIETIVAERTKAPAQWKYTIVLRLRHRRWYTW